jgi:ABC-2 type transport system ATP-binding protein
MCGQAQATQERPAVHLAEQADAVTVRSLSKRYGALMAVNDVSFSLRAGRITGFLGPNGAGKTTTLRLLLGLSQPTGGEALVFGRRYCDLVRPMHLVGAVLESDDFDPGRSGRDHLRVLGLASDVREARVDEVLDLVGLTTAARQPVRTYSLGMRQRLGLAGAILGSPKLLVLDEPANGLDASGTHWLRRFLRAFADSGGAVLMSSHDLAEVSQIVDHVLIMQRGRVLAGGTLEQITGGRRTLEDTYLELMGEEIS